MVNNQPPRPGQTLTEGNPALQLFTDRHNFIKLFAQYLNEDEQPHNKILFLTGDGGNGKSLLIKFLKEKCCKRFPQEKWHELKTKSDREVAEFIVNATDFKPVPAVLLDFGQQPIGVNEEHPQDPFYGLSMLSRRLLSSSHSQGHQLHFTLYEFACGLYLKQKGKLTPEFIKQYFDTSVTRSLIDGVINTIDNAATLFAPILTTMASQPIEHLKEQIHGYFTLGHLRGCAFKEENFEQLENMDVDTELINQLPRLFASDLKVAMSKPKAPERVVLFFDTHEAFWNEQRNLPDMLFFQRDEWLRNLLHELINLSNNRIVVVVAGREEPRWDKATKFKISQQYIDSQQVLHLSTSDARTYLQQVLGAENFVDPQLSESLIQVTSVDKDQVHPFCLGLFADCLREKIRSNTLNLDNFREVLNATDIPRILIERLLRYADQNIKYAVDALSACRAFNFELYRKLGEELGFIATKPNFNTLTEFSFVWKDEERGQDWYRIHNLVRRFNLEGNNETTQEAHVILERFYHESKNVGEEIYHAICRNWQDGATRWLDLFKSETKMRNFELCRILLEIRKELNF